MGSILLIWQMLNENRWRLLPAFPLKILDNVFSNGSDGRIATSSQRESNKEFCVLHVQSTHNYILSISTVRIQLHVSVLYVDDLQVEIFNLQISYTRCVGHLGGRPPTQMTHTSCITNL